MMRKKAWAWDLCEGLSSWLKCLSEKCFFLWVKKKMTLLLIEPNVVSLKYWNSVIYFYSVFFFNSISGWLIDQNTYLLFHWFGQDGRVKAVCLSKTNWFNTSHLSLMVNSSIFTEPFMYMGKVNYHTNLQFCLCDNQIVFSVIQGLNWKTLGSFFSWEYHDCDMF